MEKDLKQILHQELLNAYNLMEELSKPIDISWNKTKESWIGNFTIGEINYEIRITDCSDTKEGYFLFKFTANESYELVNDVKKAFTTIPTIQKAAKDFLSEVKPIVFMFCATDDSKTRRMMYDRFCNDNRKIFKYEYIKKEQPGVSMYILQDVSRVNPKTLIQSIQTAAKNNQ